MSQVILKVDRVPYQACGECMFLTTSVSQVRKHGIKDVGCVLFNESLHVSEDCIVVPCDICSGLES